MAAFLKSVLQFVGTTTLEKIGNLWLRKSSIALMKLIIHLDYFDIKTCSRGSNARTVGYLLMEISRPTKYLLLRGAKIVARLTSKNYRRSPLMQGGFEIPCSVVSIFMSLTLKNNEIIKLYKDMVDTHYTELDETAIL